LLTTIARLALRTGALQLVGEGTRLVHGHGVDPSIETYLGAIFEQEVTVGVLLGPARANRKPVLQVMNRSADLVAVAKVGINDLTDQLARTEARALSSLRDRAPKTFRIADVISIGDWNGAVVLVQSPLDVSGARVDIDERIRYSAMREVAEINGTYRTRLSRSTFWARLTKRTLEVRSGAEADCVRSLLGQIGLADRPLRFGSWHGDWTPWNMAVKDGIATIWDWERYETDVPVGFDSLHFAFMDLLRTTPQEEAGTGLVAAAPRLLHPFDLDGQRAEDVAALYLADLALRYLRDGQSDTGASGSDVHRWLKPVAARIRTNADERIE